MSAADSENEVSVGTEARRPERILDDLAADHSVQDDAIDNFAEDYPLNSDISDAERKLLDKICTSEQDLQRIRRELQAADDECRRLAQLNHRYEVLIRVCSALEELDELGGRGLFWGEGSDPTSHAIKIANARDRVDDFAAELERAEEQRLRLLDRIGDQNLTLESLDTHLRNAMEREERRRAEWVVEREPRELPYRVLIMPWARKSGEDQLFRKSLIASVLICILISLVLPMVDIPTPLRSKLTEVPERVANVIRQEQEKPNPPPPVPVPDPVIEVEPVEPKLVEELIELAGSPVFAEVEEPEAPPQIASKGILAFSNSFANSALARSSAQLGSQARVRNAGSDAIGRPERSMVTSSAPRSSGGINLAELSRNVGGDGQAIASVDILRVASVIGSGNGPERPLSAGLSAGRTDEEIQIVFDRYKSALYRLYNRELRRDPTLRGQLVLRLTIEPDGSVSLCEVQSSDMGAPSLEQQVVARVRRFDFGAKEDIVAVTIIYPIDFLPAG